MHADSMADGYLDLDGGKIKNMTVALTNLGYLSYNWGDMVCYGIPLEIHGEL